MSYKRNILKSLIFLSIPTIIEHVMSTLLQYVDTAMVGHLGENATAAVSTTTTITWLVNSVPYAFGIAILALMAKESGAKNYENTSKLSANAFIVTIICGIIMTILCVALSPFIPVWMNAAKDIRKDASEYFLIISTVMLFRSFTIIYGSALRAIKNTRTPMMINLLSNLLNIILNTVFIYGAGLGVKGAAIASAISYLIGGVLMFAFSFRDDRLKFNIGTIRPDKRILSKCMKITIPALGNIVLHTRLWIENCILISNR